MVALAQSEKINVVAQAGPKTPAVARQVDQPVRHLRAAYADPPYLGLAHAFYGDIHPEAAEYDKPETHKRLIERLCDEYDCWALSLHAPTLRTMLNFCPIDVEVMPWVKPFASFKPGVKTPHWAWEPVIVRGGRPRAERLHCVRNFVSEPMAMRKGLRGAKPRKFAFWLFEVLNLKPGDEFHDLFPGSYAVTDAWNEWRTRNDPVQHGLFQAPNVRVNSPGRAREEP